MPDIGYVNGVFSDIGSAVVSIEDRGFQFADGVYEVIVAPGGQPFRLAEHLARLKRSTDAIALPIDYSKLDLPGVIAEGVRRCGYRDVMIYLQITRGAASRDHVFPKAASPTVVATFKRQPVYEESLRERGVAVETVEDIRWKRCSIKSIALLANVLLKNAARERGFYDAVIVGEDGFVRETTTANIFIVTAGRLRTPPATDWILHGVTRGYVLECAERLGIPHAEEDFSVSDLRAADEAFISSTTADVLPVTRVDGAAIGAGQPGPLTGRLHRCFVDGRNGP